MAQREPSGRCGCVDDETRWNGKVDCRKNSLQPRGCEDLVGSGVPSQRTRICAVLGGGKSWDGAVRPEDGLELRARRGGTPPRSGRGGQGGRRRTTLFFDRRCRTISGGVVCGPGGGGEGERTLIVGNDELRAERGSKIKILLALRARTTCHSKTFFALELVPPARPPWSDEDLMAEEELT